MDTIILEFMKKAMDLVKKSYDAAAKDGMDISEVIDSIKEATDKLGQDIVRMILEEVDQQLIASTARKRNWIIQSKNNVKNILTKLGMITYQRTYFFSKDKQEYKYLVDEIYGITPHDRMDAAMEAHVVELSSEMSFRKSGKLASEVELSGQTVMNKLRNQQEIKVERVAEKKSEINVLYIEADEDHIALQDGTSSITKLIYVHEGLEHIGKSRNELINPFYFSSVTSSAPAIWEETWEYVKNNYDVDKIKRIYVQGDGARWIRTGLEYFPKVKFVLDRYHMNKYVLRATSRDKSYFSQLWNCLNTADKEDFIQTIDELIKKTESEEKKKDIKECKEYMMNNWDGIEVQAYEDKYMIGCSAEGHVSHVLSDRMSSRPLGWSIHGADDMARLRAYIKNSGRVYELIKLRKAEEPCKLVTRQLLSEAKKRIKRKFSEGINNIEILNQGRKSELFDELKRIRYKAI